MSDEKYANYQGLFDARFSEIIIKTFVGFERSTFDQLEKNDSNHITASLHFNEQATQELLEDIECGFFELPEGTSLEWSDGTPLPFEPDGEMVTRYTLVYGPKMHDYLCNVRRESFTVLEEPFSSLDERKPVPKSGDKLIGKYSKREYTYVAPYPGAEGDHIFASLDSYGTRQIEIISDYDITHQDWYMPASTFFEPGKVYESTDQGEYRKGSTFTVESISNSPDKGKVYAFGWWNSVVFPGPVTATTMDEDDFPDFKEVQDA